MWFLNPHEMLATQLGPLQLECCVYNASGPRTGSAEALAKIGGSRAGAVLSKSATLVKQDGNPMPRAIAAVDLGAASAAGSMNSEGLPNYGIDYYLSADAVASAPASKPYIVSLSGLKLADNLEMLGRALLTDGVAAIELNLACPNIPGKPTVAYDFEQMEQILRAVTTHAHFGKKPLGVKLAPYFDMPHFERACDILARYPLAFVVCINTIGNALFIDADKECAVITPKGGYGGLGARGCGARRARARLSLCLRGERELSARRPRAGGGYVKHTALANVRKIFEGLVARGRDDIAVVGVGGVASGRDAFEHILCGASAVQVGTCHWSEGAACFERIASELEAIMRAKGYRSIADFRGKLRTYEKGAKFHAAGKGGSATRASGTLAATRPDAVHLVMLLVIAALVARLAQLGF